MALTKLLAEQGNVKGLIREVAAGTLGAVEALRTVRSRMST